MQLMPLGQLLIISVYKKGKNEIGDYPISAMKSIVLK